MIADGIAAVTIGLITKFQTQNGRHGNSQDLYAFWASFLLLHLGGPDSITSFALEDNEFWLRHLFGLILLVMSAERTAALYLASFNHFGDAVGDPEGPDAEGTEFDFKLASESVHMDLVMLSYSLFKFFNGIIGGLLLGVKLVESSKNLFRSSHQGSCVKGNNKDHDFGGFELSLTYALLIGAIGLDTISGLKLLFSDWILVSNNGLIKRWRKCIPEFVLKRKRWCGSVPQYNMIDYCLDERWIWKFNKFPHCFRFMIDNIKFTLFSSSLSVDDFEQLKRFIFEQFTYPILGGFDEMVSSVTNKVNIAQLILRMHLATEIRYHRRTETEDQERNRERRICKMVSDYMFYLLIMKPEMMGSSVKGVNWKKVFQDTFAEAKSQLMRHKIYDHLQACNHFMNYEPDKLTSSKSLLSKAGPQDSGDANLWVGMLCFVAIKCRPMLHAQQPSRGGELLTFTLFLIQHFGLIPGDVYARTI
ncbi:hypothetical protein FEM48_Zijuj11G0135300 [Ziziphus jujuba var. spinosa]|uniref:DUF4220 domain-containing protein n=1 Tax=Ziziphus jujuba var. spinosa TaxID=714518 RepID=A0A978UJ79_ZIZJJ|nr:hypothetical protein FEM48_Zijuj11G0135300 [Ziziphus jujuba var. spinosa]